MAVLFVNTRPNALDASVFFGDTITTLSLPLLCFEPLAVPLLCFEASVLVCVSVPAVRFAYAALSNTQKQTLTQKVATHQLTVVAVGQATQVAFFECFGLSALCPPASQANNEGLWEMPVLQSLGANDKVLVWAGEGGRTWLMDKLTQRGVQVQKCAWYRRQCTKVSLEGVDFSAFCRVWVLIGSAKTYECWQALCLHHRLSLLQFGYIALGKRLTDLIKNQLPACDIKTVFDLSQTSLGQALERR